MKVCPQCGSEYELDQRFCPKDGSALRSSGGAKDLLGQVIAERYHILKKLGEGGMGQVYLAEHVKMGRKSAVKVMHAAMNADADAVSRFNREAANAARISHPNVCAIYDFGETPDGMIYLAMEFIEGQSLTAIVEQAGALAPSRAGDLVRQVGAALAVAHDQGIVHRDLKPDNIMVTRTKDGADLVKVVDFGIAKASDNEAQKVTKTGLVVGTPEYMSPEQLAGDKLDGRSDIYSLGLVAYNCLTGTLPFQSESAQEAMIMRLTDVPRRLAEVKPDVAWPDALQQVMDRVLARDARDRYASATEFARDFARALDAMPAAAADGATMVIGAASAAAARGGATAVSAAAEARTQAVPSTRVARPSERPSQSAAAGAAPSSGSGSSTGMIIGAVVLLAAAGGGYAMFGRGGNAPTAGTTAGTTAGMTNSAAPTTPPSSTPAPEATPGPAAGGEGSTPTPAVAGPTASPTTPARSGGDGAGSADVARELARLRALVESDDVKKAAQGLDGVIDLLPRLKTRAERAEGGYIRALGTYYSQDPPQKERACRLANETKAIARGTAMQEPLAQFLGAVCGE